MRIKDLPEVVQVDDETNQKLLRDHIGEKTGWYQVGPQKYLLPSKYAEECELFMNIKTRPDDIWISTFPRTGTTLTQELVWMLANNCDFEKAKNMKLWERTPFLEMDLFFHDETKNNFLSQNLDNEQNQEIIEAMAKPAFEYLDDMDSPRVIKTHFPPSLLPWDIEQTGAKVIYVTRNPKDVVISYYHHLRLWKTSDYSNSFEVFAKQFLAGIVPWGPFWPHAIEGWENRHKENYFFMFYEDMVKDMPEAIRKFANFLNIPVDEENVDALADHLDINNFKNNSTVNMEELRGIGVLAKNEESFIRRGKERGSSNEFTDELKKLFDDWIQQHYEETDLRFPQKS